MRTYCAAGIGPPFADPTVSGLLARRPTNDFSCNVLFFLRQRTAAGGLSNHRGCMSTQAVGIWHIGTVSYGNIGAADRLHFTVIGPAVNLVSRIEGMAKALDRPILVGSDFAQALGDGLVSVGLHHVRGLVIAAAR